MKKTERLDVIVVVGDYSHRDLLLLFGAPAQYDDCESINENDKLMQVLTQYPDYDEYKWCYHEKHCYGFPRKHCVFLSQDNGTYTIVDPDVDPQTDLMDNIIYMDNDVGMYDILVEIGAFPSKSQARKNWKYTDKKVPMGYSEFEFGKLNHQLTIWKHVD